MSDKLFQTWDFNLVVLHSETTWGAQSHKIPISILCCSNFHDIKTQCERVKVEDENTDSSLYPE